MWPRAARRRRPRRRREGRSSMWGSSSCRSGWSGADGVELRNAYGDGGAGGRDAGPVPARRPLLSPACPPRGPRGCPRDPSPRTSLPGRQPRGLTPLG
jgi:hypothetical protein